MPLAALLAVLKQQPQAARQPAGRDESVDGQPSHVVISSWLLAAMWHTRRAVLRCRLEQQRTRAETSDADTTIFVGIGARSGGIRACGWFKHISSPSWQ